MAKRLYIVPKVQGAGRAANSFGPKYIWALGYEWAGMDYGLEAWYLVCADLPPSVHDLLVLNPDVTALPEDIDQEIGQPALTTVQAKLEAANLPADWVTASHTYRFVLRMVTGAIRLAQRCHGNVRRTGGGAGGRLFPPGITLDTQYNQLAPIIQAALIEAADQFQIDRTGLTGASTMREILRTFGQQVPQAQILGIWI